MHYDSTLFAFDNQNPFQKPSRLFFVSLVRLHQSNLLGESGRGSGLFWMDKKIYRGFN